MPTRDEIFMERCIELAENGAGHVSPNPLVGCVIVKNGKIVAEGFHKKYGTFHAERAAINSALKKGISLKGAELYVNLEPCAHFGKTPPCSNLILEHKFSRVVIGIKDPYHLVAGKGIRLLKKNGIKVKVGVLENECRELNNFFFKLVITGLPYVMIKTAQTIDGKIADYKNRSKWISSPESRRLVHALRANYDAVLVGKNTVKYDNPELTVRMIKGRDPIRVIIDEKAELNLKSKVFTGRSSAKTIMITSHLANISRIKGLEKLGVKIIFCRSTGGIIDINDALKKLASVGITSIMVEGGSFTYSEFIKKNLVDEFMIFIAPKVMGSGIEAFTSPNQFKNFKQFNYYTSGTDVLVNIKK